MVAVRTRLWALPGAPGRPSGAQRLQPSTGPHRLLLTHTAHTAAPRTSARRAVRARGWRPGHAVSCTWAAAARAPAAQPRGALQERGAWPRPTAPAPGLHRAAAARCVQLCARVVCVCVPATFYPFPITHLVQVSDAPVAEKWQMPRVFEPGGRHAAMLAGLTGEERRARVGRIAKGLGHWAIPQDEALHLSATVHSSLMIGGMKCSGEKAMCAHCLKNGMRTEETAAHTHTTGAPRPRPFGRWSWRTGMKRQAIN